MQTILTQKPDFSKLAIGFKNRGQDENLRVFPSHETKHQFISLRIAAALLAHAEPNDLGQVLQAPFDVLLTRETVVQPDIIFVERGRTGLIGSKGLWGAPDLAIEILSPKTRAVDLVTKRKIYSRFEVKEYWTVDPDAELVEVLLWSELGYATAGIYGKSNRLLSPSLPGFKMQLCKLFSRKC